MGGLYDLDQKVSVSAALSLYSGLLTRVDSSELCVGARLYLGNMKVGNGAMVSSVEE